MKSIFGWISCITVLTLGIVDISVGVAVGDICNQFNIKTCPQSGFSSTNLTMNICADGGPNGTCPASGTGTLLGCQGTNTGGFFCKNCGNWGSSCTQDTDCCLGFDQVGDSALLTPIKPYCHRPANALGIRPTSGTCLPCLHTFDACTGSKLPFCNVLNYPTSTAACRVNVSSGQGIDHMGHNMGYRYPNPMAAPDPCTPEAKILAGDELTLTVSGTSQCGTYSKDAEGFAIFAESLYGTEYFCNCPDSELVGYSCQVNNTILGLLNTLGLGPLVSKTDNGQRCQRCGLKGNICGGVNNLPCCDNHSCTSGQCQPSTTCTMEGNRIDWNNNTSPCCGGSSYHRDSHTGRCTNAKCTPVIGHKCYGPDEDCCGIDIRCIRDGPSLLANRTCLNCVADNGTCLELYDCCGARTFYQTLTPDDFSYCKYMGSGNPKICAPCIPEDGVCDPAVTMNTCCNNLVCQETDYEDPTGDTIYACQ